MVVYLLHHVREDEESEDIKLCGVYSSQSLAEAARAQLSLCSGFRDYLDGFSIDEYVLDRMEWSEGFGDMTADES